MSQLTYRAALLGAALVMALVMPTGSGWADQQSKDHSFSISPDHKSKAKARAKASCSGDCTATTGATTSVVVDPVNHNVTSTSVSTGTTSGGSSVISNSSVLVSHNSP